MVGLVTGIFAVLYGSFWMLCLGCKNPRDRLLDDEAQVEFIEEWKKARCKKIFNF